MAMTATETATPSSRLAETAQQTSTYEEVTKQKQRIVVIETDKKKTVLLQNYGFISFRINLYIIQKRSNGNRFLLI